LANNSKPNAITAVTPWEKYGARHARLAILCPIDTNLLDTNLPDSLTIVFGYAIPGFCQKFDLLGSGLIWKISLRTFATLCVLCEKKAFKTINRKERQERKDHAKSWS